MSKLCRTCLAEIPDTTYVTLNTKDVKAESVQAQLAACVPELQLNLVEDPVVCGNCLSSLELAYTFKIRCLLTEKRIQSCIRRAKLNEKRLALAELFSFSKQSSSSGCSVINNFERRELGAVSNYNMSGEQFFAGPEILSQDVQNDDNTEEGTPKTYISSTAKQDSNVVINNDVTKTVREEEDELHNVVKNCEITVESIAKNLECRESNLRSSCFAISTVNGYDISRDLDDTKEDTIVKEECEILTIKSEKDEVSNLKKEYINDEEKGNNSCKTVTLSEVSNTVGSDVTGANSNVIRNTDAKDLFDGDYKFPLFTTEDDIIEENYSNASYLCHSYFDVASLADASANTNINEHKAASVKNCSANYEEERINNCSNSSPCNSNNGYAVNSISQEMNGTIENIIIKEENEPETFNTEEEDFKICTVNIDVPIKQCCVNLERKSSFNVNELLKSVPQEFREDSNKKMESVRETNKILRRNFIENKQACTNEESLSCNICDFISTTKLSLLKHAQTHKGKKGYCCNVCDYSTVYRHGLVKHLSKHTGNQPFRCTTCECNTARKGDSAWPMKIHTGEKPFSCKICEYRRRIKSCLVQHTSEKPFVCGVCGFSTRLKDSLIVHIRSHTGEKPFRCSTCEYSAATKAKLVVHMRIHTGEKVFSCSTCDYKTTRKAHLDQHLRIHTTEKPFVCSSCDYKTARKGHLVQHIRIHTGEKPYRCDLCEFSTANRCNLTKHILTHTGEKPFSCISCKYKATQKGDLVKHMRKHSANESSKKSTKKYNVK